MAKISRHGGATDAAVDQDDTTDVPEQAGDPDVPDPEQADTPCPRSTSTCRRPMTARRGAWSRRNGPAGTVPACEPSRLYPERAISLTSTALAPDPTPVRGPWSTTGR